MEETTSTLKIGRRGFLTRCTALASPFILSGGSAYGYGSVVERHRLVTEQHDLQLSLGQKGPSGLRAVSLSDIHFDPLYEEDFVEECIGRINDLQPDVVLLTGDYITSSSRRMNDLTAILGKLNPKVGVYACLGNHDVWDVTGRVMAALKQIGIDVLVNQHVRVPCNDGELIIAGLHSAWGGQPSWGAASRGLAPDERALLLMHEPDFARRLQGDDRIALQCSGHTHGGQVRLPVIGALELPTWGRIYQAGFYDVGGMKLYVSRGLGTITHHVRFLCPPEITCFDIVNCDRVLV